MELFLILRHEQHVQGARRQRLERFVRGREHGEGPVPRKRLDEFRLLDGGDEGRESRGALGGLDDGHPLCGRRERGGGERHRENRGDASVEIRVHGCFLFRFFGASDFAGRVAPLRDPNARHGESITGSPGVLVGHRICCLQRPTASSDGLRRARNRVRRLAVVRHLF